MESPWLYDLLTHSNFLPIRAQAHGSLARLKSASDQGARKYHALPALEELRNLQIDEPCDQTWPEMIDRAENILAAVKDDTEGSSGGAGGGGLKRNRETDDDDQADRNERARQRGNTGVSRVGLTRPRLERAHSSTGHSRVLLYQRR